MAKNLNDVNIYDGLDALNKNENKSLDKKEVNKIDIECLVEFRNHPFKVKEDDDMKELVDSIKSQGIINPIIVRTINDGGFEIITGHRRVHACKLLGMKEVPARIENLSDNDAALIMVDSNIQRTSLLPSEKAFAYKIKLEALAQKDKLESTGKVPDRAAALSEETGDSKKTIYRFIKLTNLLPELLNLVDQGKLKASASGYTIACMPIEAQEVILKVYEESAKLPSAKQAVIIKDYALNNTINKDYVLSILQADNEKTSSKVFSNKIRKYFPAETSDKEMEDIIITLLENWSNI